MHTVRYAIDDNRELICLCKNPPLTENLSLRIELNALPGMLSPINKAICKKHDCFWYFPKTKDHDVYKIKIVMVCFISLLLRFVYKLMSVQWNKRKLRHKYPVTDMDRPLELQELEAPKFPDNRQLRMAWLSGQGTGQFYPPPPPDIFLVLISVTHRKY